MHSVVYMCVRRAAAEFSPCHVLGHDGGGFRIYGNRLASANAFGELSPVLDNQPFERVVEESPSHLLREEDVEKAVPPPLAAITDCLWEGRGMNENSSSSCMLC